MQVTLLAVLPGLFTTFNSQILWANVKTFWICLWIWNCLPSLPPYCPTKTWMQLELGLFVSASSLTELAKWDEWWLSKRPGHLHDHLYQARWSATDSYKSHLKLMRSWLANAAEDFCKSGWLWLTQILCHRQALQTIHLDTMMTALIRPMFSISLSW